jgi:hypothetical protein
MGRLNKEDFSDISERVRAARDNISRIQNLLQANPSDSGLWKEEVEAVNNYSRLRRAEESFLRQKSRVHGLDWGTKAPNSSSILLRARKRMRGSCCANEPNPTVAKTVLRFMLKGF